MIWWVEMTESNACTQAARDQIELARTECLSLKHKALMLVRSFKKPPQAIQQVFIAVNILCSDTFSPDWDDTKKILFCSPDKHGSINSIIRRFDVDNVDRDRVLLAGQVIRGLEEESVYIIEEYSVVFFRFVRAVCDNL